MRMLLLLSLLSHVVAADTTAPQMTADDLQNLLAFCSRLTVAQLTPAELQAMAYAEARGQATLQLMRAMEKLPPPVIAPTPAPDPKVKKP
jgi:hypothetical protein